MNGTGIEMNLRPANGFTVVELLVVMLILALLAAIAIPAFFSQREKARDADARSALAVAQGALEIYSTDHDGSYSGASPADLVEIEGSLAGESLSVDAADRRTYEMHVVSEDGQTFRVLRAADGTVVRTCTPAGSGGCSDDGDF